nr:zinc finger, CCHC-type [Tanacetum cinerariifolium]
MGDKNPIRTLEDFSKPSHKGYQNTIELIVRNNVVPLRSDTIWLVQNGCSFHGLRSEDPNQHLKDFLKLVDSLDLDVANRERKRMRLFQFSLHDQASNQLEHLPVGSIFIWEDLNTHFLAQLFSSGRTAKLCNDILMNSQPAKTPEKVLIREETRHPTTKNVNSISIIQMKEEKSIENNEVTDKSMAEPSKYDEQKPPKEVDKPNEGRRRADNEPAKGARDNVTKNKEEEQAEVSSSHARLTNKRPAETDIRLSLASHSYIYPIGIAKDVLVDIAGYVYPIDFMILDIKEDEKRPFILGTPFLTTAKAVIKFYKGTITLKSEKSKKSFHRIPKPHCRIEKGIKNAIEPIAPMMTVNSVFINWEALGGNTRNLDSIWEETGQDYSFTRIGFKDARTVPGDDVAIPIDAVRTYKRYNIP